MPLKGEELKNEAPKTKKTFENPVNKWMNECMHACMTDWLNEWIRMDACMHACMDTWMQGWKDDFISSKYGFNLLIKDDTSKANTNYSDNYSLTTASLSIFKTYTWTQIWDILNLIEWF